MLEYDAQHFQSEYEKPLGQQLWVFLNSSECLIRMDTATYLGRPAAEGVEPLLLHTFGKVVKESRVKQMIGHMIRQVMEANGYVVDQGGVRIRNELVFMSATRYKKPE